MIGHEFPYLDTRDLNLDWLLKNMKQLLQDWATYQQTMNQNFANLQAAVNQFETDITTAFNNLHDYVEDYFDNLDVQEEINNKLEAMRQSGELAEIINPLISTVTGNWLSTHITNPSNPPIDTSLSISNAAADAKVTGDRLSTLDAQMEVTNQATGVYKETLVANNIFPYVDLNISLKNGDVLCIDVIEYSGDPSTVESFFLYDIEGAATLAGFSLTEPNYYKATSDISALRLIVRQTTAPQTALTLAFKCYVLGDESLADISDNRIPTLDAQMEVTNQATGVYKETLTDSGIFPYVDLDISLTNGDILCVDVINYSGDLSNVESFYLYDVTGGTTLAGLSLTAPSFYKATSNFSALRLIVRQTTEPQTALTLAFKCYVLGDGTLADISDNRKVFERVVNTVSGQAVNLNNLPFYARKNDVFQLEIIDEDGILSGAYHAYAGYKNNGVNVNQIVDITRPYTRGTVDLKTDVDPNSLIVYISGSYVSATGAIKIRYKNMTLLGANPKHKALSSFSILGDSYSTFAGYTNPVTNRQWYPTNDPSAQGYESGNNVTSLVYTWFYILATETELYMHKNASYSGSTICYDSYGTGQADGKETSFIQRDDDLENSSIVFIFGGTNDAWAGASIGDYKYSDWTEADLSYFAPALAYLINDIRNKYIGMDIAFIENDILPASFKTAIETVCAHYNVPVIKPVGVSKTHDHPNTDGMRTIGNTVKKFVETYAVMPYYD